MKKIKLPCTSERIIGVSLPIKGVFYVCDHDEVHEVTLSPNVSVRVLNNDPFEMLESLPLKLSLYEDKPLISINENSISYTFEPTKDYVDVNYIINGETGNIRFGILSGDWFSASFSNCGNYLMLAEPYEYALYCIE